MCDSPAGFEASLKTNGPWTGRLEVEIVIKTHYYPKVQVETTRRIRSFTSILTDLLNEIAEYIDMW